MARKKREPKEVRRFKFDIGGCRQASIMDGSLSPGTKRYGACIDGGVIGSRKLLKEAEELLRCWVRSHVFQLREDLLDRAVKAHQVLRGLEEVGLQGFVVPVREREAKK